MNRNSKASLSPSELASLRGVTAGSNRQIPDSPCRLLLSMGLIVTDGDGSRLTEAGRQRLDPEERAPNPSRARHAGSGELTPPAPSSQKLLV
jgi:hypothetical protein